MQPSPWESALHNHDRTVSRSDHRYTAPRVGGFELSELADPSWSRDTDPGFQALMRRLGFPAPEAVGIE